METTEIKQQDITPVKKGQPHRWKKGDCPNPNGRPKSPEKELLRKALSKDEKKNGHLIDFAVKRARVSDVVLVAILKKMLPDMTEADLKGSLDSGTKIIIVRPNSEEQNRNRDQHKTVSR